MKFGSQLEHYKLPEWASYYLDFLALRKRIRQLKSVLDDHSFDMIDMHDLLLVSEPRSYLNSATVAIVDLERAWVQAFAREVMKLNQFYGKKKLEYLQELEETFLHVQRHHGNLKEMVRKSDHYDPRQRIPSILRALQIAHRNLWCLEVYSEINYLACIK